MPHALQRSTLAGIGTTGSLVAAVATIAAVTTGVVAFHAWPTPHRASSQALEIGPGASVGARTPLLAPAFGVGRAGTLPFATLPPAIVKSVGAVGPAAPTTAVVQPGSGSATSPAAASKGPIATLVKPSPSNPVGAAAAAVPDRIAAATADTGRSTAATLGTITDNVGKSTAKVSPTLATGVERGGAVVQDSVVKTADGLAGLLGSMVVK